MFFSERRHQRAGFAVANPLIPIGPVLALGDGAKLGDERCAVFCVMTNAAGGGVELTAALTHGGFDMALHAVVLKNGLPVLCG